MKIDAPARIVAAAVLVLSAALGVLPLGAPAWASILFFAAGIAAILLIAWPGEDIAIGPAPASTESGAGVETVIDAIAEPVLIVAGGRVVQANAAARDLLGAHIIGEDVRLAIRHPAAAEALTANGEEPSAIDLVGIGGREGRWEMRIAPVSGNRRVVHLLDRAGSHAAERMRVDFVANASHELRTPLAAILGFIETLADDKAGADPATRARFLKVMNDEAVRMQRLVDDLISLSRIEAEKYRPPEAAIDLAALLDECLAAIRGATGERGADIVADIAEIPPIAGDRAQLSQLIHNLVGNAMKYGRHGTPVAIRLAPADGGMIGLAVSDQGEGIAPEHLPRLTERFYRIDSSRSRALGGTGLGLSIVKHIVERHRGRLDIASVAGEGTTVTVLLPAAREALSSKSHAQVTEGA